ncbi:hypothetical protein AAY473_016863 [Plecturocebus cupreus]
MFASLELLTSGDPSASASQNGVSLIARLGVRIGSLQLPFSVQAILLPQPPGSWDYRHAHPSG